MSTAGRVSCLFVMLKVARDVADIRLAKTPP